MNNVDVCELIEPEEQVAEPEISIRSMQIKDLDRVTTLEKMYFQHPWSRKSIAYEIQDNRYAFSYVVELNEHIIGYVIGWCIACEAHIGTLAIDYEYRRNKIGHRLLNFLLEHFKSEGIQTVHLEVRRSNQIAQNLYSKHGFKVAGVRKNYYSKEKEDALIMSLSIKEV